MSSLKNVGARLQIKLNALEKKTNEAIKSAAVTGVEYLANNTPVDTSRALSNWILTVGKPTSDYITARVHGEGGSTQDMSARLTVEAAKGNVASRQPRQPIYIQNNAPYIKRLNDGYSPQGEHFHEAAILLMRKALLFKKRTLK